MATEPQREGTHLLPSFFFAVVQRRLVAFVNSFCPPLFMVSQFCSPKSFAQWAVLDLLAWEWYRSSDLIGFYTVFIGIIFFVRFYEVSIEFDWFSGDRTSCYWVLLGFYWVFPSFVWFYWVWQGFARFYWVSIDFDWFSGDRTSCYWVLLGFYCFFLGFVRIYWVLQGFSRFC